MDIPSASAVAFQASYDISQGYNGDRINSPGSPPDMTRSQSQSTIGTDSIMSISPSSSGYSNAFRLPTYFAKHEVASSCGGNDWQTTVVYDIPAESYPATFIDASQAVSPDTIGSPSWSFDNLKSVDQYSYESFVYPDPDHLVLHVGSHHALIDLPQELALQGNPSLFDKSGPSNGDAPQTATDFRRYTAQTRLQFPEESPEDTYFTSCTDLEAHDTGGAAQGAPVRPETGPEDQYSSGSASPSASRHLTNSPAAGRTQRKKRYLCKFPGCGRGASRQADLQRHYNTVHGCSQEGKKNTFTCDYKKCARNLEGFRRPDHFRDHLRDFHKEDMLRRGKGDEGADWWDERSTQSMLKGWWRCSKCFVRVSIKKYGYNCSSCGKACERQRVEMRQQRQEKMLSSSLEPCYSMPDFLGTVSVFKDPSKQDAVCTDTVKTDSNTDSPSKSTSDNEATMKSSCTSEAEAKQELVPETKSGLPTIRESSVELYLVTEPEGSSFMMQPYSTPCYVGMPG